MAFNKLRETYRISTDRDQNLDEVTKRQINTEYWYLIRAGEGESERVRERKKECARDREKGDTRRSDVTTRSHAEQDDCGDCFVGVVFEGKGKVLNGEWRISLDCPEAREGAPPLPASPLVLRNARSRRQVGKRWRALTAASFPWCVFWLEGVEGGAVPQAPSAESMNTATKPVLPHEHTLVSSSRFMAKWPRSSPPPSPLLLLPALAFARATRTPTRRHPSAIVCL